MSKSGLSAAIRRRSGNRKAGLPLGAHAMMIAWLADDLRIEGIEAEIFWADGMDAHEPDAQQAH